MVFIDPMTSFTAPFVGQVLQSWTDGTRIVTARVVVWVANDGSGFESELIRYF